MRFMNRHMKLILGSALPILTQYKITLDLLVQGCYIRCQGKLGILY